jgi:hypothetical protein
MVQVDHDSGGVTWSEFKWSGTTSAKQDTPLLFLTRLMAFGHASVKQTHQFPMSHSRRAFYHCVSQSALTELTSTSLSLFLSFGALNCVHFAWELRGRRRREKDMCISKSGG